MKQVYSSEETRMQHDENEMLKELLLQNVKTPVRVANFLLEEIEKLAHNRQEYVNIAVIEKLARDSDEKGGN